MVIVGLNAYHGDASAAVVADGKIVAAAEEERFNRIKHSAGFPSLALQYCLDEAGVSAGEIDHIAIARDPRARLGHKLLYAMRMPRQTLERIKVQRKFVDIGQDLSALLGLEGSEKRPRFHRVEHHRAHLASSYYCSSFDRSALLSIDGFGDFASGMWGVGEGARIDLRGSFVFPHSLGIYYTAITQYLGFPNYGDEYKVMGLASYGEPEFADEFRAILRSDGILGFDLGLDYFIHHRDGVEMSWKEGAPKIGRLFSPFLEKRLGPARAPTDELTRKHQNIACSLQKRLEEIVLSLLNGIAERTGETNLCLAGGVAFNCVVNGLVRQRTPFDGVYVQPAAGDAGLAVGAALDVWHRQLGGRRSFAMSHAYWGPAFGEERLRATLERKRAELERQACKIRHLACQDELCLEAARLVAVGQIVGWYQGRMEWGPRALGNRSIVADPRRPDMKDLLNTRIKRRESFRPFAPSILEEHVSEYFEQTYPSPFMQMTYHVRPNKRDLIPATTHVDGTGRLQTVSRETNPLFWQLIEEFRKISSVPAVLNTSFNENEPIVCTPEQAVECFLRADMDSLAIGPFLLTRQTETGRSE